MRGEVRGPGAPEARGRGAGAAQAACTRGGPDWRLGARARVKRTWNMRCMSVTLDVSKLSGWLKAHAHCRVERGVYDARRGTGREGVERRRRKRHARERPDLRLGARTRAERTQNIWFMFVTLDVSKLSVWLNADAFCQVERRACDAGRGAAREAGWA